MYDKMMKIKRASSRLLAILLAVCLLLCTVNLQSLTAFAAADADSDKLTAAVAKTDGSGDPVSLMAEGGTAVASEWAYDETRKLTITADFTGVTDTRILKIELPVGMCFNIGGYPTEANNQIQSCEYVPCTLPPGYTAAATGGTLTYTINPNAAIVVLNILISYDEQLWNKENGGSVTGKPGEEWYKAPIKVTKTANSTTETKILSEVTTYTDRDPAKLYYVSYNSDPELAYAKPLNTSVSMGRHYIYNGRSGSQINSTPKLYWKKVTLIQEAPYKEVNGEKVYAEYVNLEKKDIYPNDPGGYAISYDETMHKTTVVWNDKGNFTYGMPSINAKYSFPEKEGGFAADDKITYPQPLIYVQGIYGEEYQYNNPDLPTEAAKTVHFKLSNTGKLDIKAGNGQKSFPVSETNTDVVYFLHNFLVSNQGAVDSGRQKFTYTFEGKSGMGVTSMRLVMPRQDDCKLNENKKVVVSCTVVDAKGIEVPDYTATFEVAPSLNDTGKDVILSRNENMVKNNYYFHTISYEVGTLRQGTLYYANSSAFLSGGAIYGKLTGSKEHVEDSESCLSATLKIDPIDGKENGSTPLTIRIPARGDETPTTTIGLRNTDPLGENKDAVGNTVTTFPAGGTLKVTAQLEASDYPYHSTTFISHPVFYLRLPEELTLVMSSLSTDRDISAIVQTPFSETDASGKETGYTLTPINFGNAKVPVGYYGEDLDAVKIGGKSMKTLTLTFALQASNKISQTTQYDLRDLVCVADEKVSLSEINSGWNPCNWSHNPGKGTKDGFSAEGFRATYQHTTNTNATFTVQAAAPMVAFQAAVKNHYGTTDADYDKKLTFIGNTGSIDYRISFDNKQGGTVDGSKFYYLIQLPKKGESISSHISSIGNASFDFSLTGPVKLKSEYADLYDVQYSTDKPTDAASPDFYNNGKADYTNTDGYATYHLEEDFGKNGLKWEDVRCIKLVVKDKGNESARVIPNGESCIITLENVEWDVSIALGNTDFNWSACGLQRYDLKDAASEGHTPTNPVTFHIHPFTITSSATLTGVRGDSPAGTTKTTTISIPAYIHSKTLKLQSVTVDGEIKLVPLTEMGNKKGEGNSWGDQNFTLTAKLNEGSTVDVLTNNAGTNIGATTPEEISTLTITLDHADLLSTNSKVCTVTVVIGEDKTDGTKNVEITETITIRTIGTEMNENYPASVMSQGKSFSRITTDNKQVKITTDSAVSVQFNLQSYLYSNYREPYITGVFPTGATLILADISNSKQPKYYYYLCSRDKTNNSQILLSEFVSMDDGTSPFQYGQLPVDAKLLFVEDYAQATVTISDNELSQTLGLVFPAKTDGAQTDRSAEAAWVLTPKREFTINVDSAESGMSMTSKGMAKLFGSLNSQQLVGNDTCHSSDYLTLSLTLYEKNGTTPVNFPAGATITANSVKTGTAENKALLTLGKVRANEVPFDILLKTAGWGLSPGEYKLKAELYYSRAEGYVSAVSQKPEAIKEIILTVTDDPSYGLKVEQTGDTRRLVDPGAKLTFNLDYAVPEGKSATFSATLYKKTNGDYSKTKAWKTQPKFIDSKDGPYTAEIQIPSTVEKGATYRILFQMECDGKVIEVPYNIIVRE